MKERLTGAEEEARQRAEEEERERRRHERRGPFGLFGKRTVEVGNCAPVGLFGCMNNRVAVWPACCLTQETTNLVSCASCVVSLSGRRVGDFEAGPPVPVG